MISEVAGWVGACTILGSYLLLSLGWVEAGYRFQAANLLGSMLFIIYGIYQGTWPAVTTNAAWLLISVVALVRLRATRKRDTETSSPAS